MSLLQKIGKNIDSCIVDFCKEISSRFDIDHSELMDIWKKTSGASNTAKPKKRTAYNNFSVIIRKELKEQNPEINFGQQSKEISKKWKQLDETEKAKYKDALPETNTNNFKSMKIAQLREMCKDKGLNNKGKKAELIERLVNHQSDPKSPQSNLSTPRSIGSTPSQSPKSNSSTPSQSPKSNSSTPQSLHSNSSQSLMEEEEDEIDFSVMKLPEIKKICKEKGLDIKGKNKNDLIELLIENQKN